MSISITCILFCMAIAIVQAQKQVPCLFYFGDSLFDNGNNNHLITKAKANYPPYGIDYPQGSTGRFTNGPNMADYLTALLGFPESIAPFVNASDSDIVNGVNYASGGSGILQESGNNLGQHIPMDEQLRNHGRTIARLALLYGIKNTTAYLSHCLYVSYIGSNDYINNYFLPQNLIKPTPQSFANILVDRYHGQLQSLYGLGARKIAVFGLGLIGCIPQELNLYPPTNGSPCVDDINGAVVLFNNGLQSLITQFNNNLRGANFTFINSFAISQTPLPPGVNGTAPCCVVSSATNGQCVPGSTPCSVRETHVFYDNFHPVSIFAQGLAASAYSASSPAFASPYDIYHLVNG